MRPLYAIAPLALLLALVGPTPHEANKVLSDFKDRLIGAKEAAHSANRDTASAGKPAMLGGNAPFAANGNGTVVETAFRP